MLGRLKTRRFAMGAPGKLKRREPFANGRRHQRRVAPNSTAALPWLARLQPSPMSECSRYGQQSPVVVLRQGV